MNRHLNTPLDNILDARLYEFGVPVESIMEAANSRDVVKVVDPITGEHFWVLLSIEAIDFVSKRPSAFSSHQKSAIPEEYNESELSVVRNQFINMDSPKHIEYRRLVAKYFSDTSLSNLEPFVIQTCKENFESFFSEGEGDFVECIATPLPIWTMLKIIGLPDVDIMKLSTLINRILYGRNENQSSDLFLYILQLIENREDQFDKAQDCEGSMLNCLSQARINGKKLSLEELVSFVAFMLVAGTSSTQATIAHAIRLMIEHPLQYDLLCDSPELIDSAIEEVLRFSPAFICMRRTAVEKIGFKDVEFSPGDKVILFYPSANRCEKAFGKDSHSFDITRSITKRRQTSKHRTFGVGTHFCLGNQLAKLELRVVFKQMIANLRELEFTQPLSYFHSNHLSSIKSMNVGFTKFREHAK